MESRSTPQRAPRHEGAATNAAESRRHGDRKQRAPATHVRFRHQTEAHAYRVLRDGALRTRSPKLAGGPSRRVAASDRSRFDPIPAFDRLLIKQELTRRSPYSCDRAMCGERTVSRFACAARRAEARKQMGPSAKVPGRGRFPWRTRYQLEPSSSPASTCSTSARRERLRPSMRAAPNPHTTAPAVPPRASRDPHPESSLRGGAAAGERGAGRPHRRESLSRSR
jgi:hypothetical protein